ncbi:peptidylprolyl isomerase PpiC [Pectobacteriaceae bacterium CE70]|nr:peptidylprolyl isomerase PpiC [Pectobacteriaceae bacterium CE70]WJY10674.1 peptidylprolyl isomerase PpiC [Pectobacteriaceae bacterium C80]
MAHTAAALHILVDTEQQANDILDQLEKGADFQQMAQKFSTCPSKRNGGDLGEFRQGDMVPAFDKAVFSGELLKPFGPIKTQFGYHIIKVLYRN